jgi:hypothetical protein
MENLAGSEASLSPPSESASPLNQLDKKTGEDNTINKNAPKLPYDEKPNNFDYKGIESNNNNQNFLNYHHNQCNQPKNSPDKNDDDSNLDSDSEIDLTSTQSNVLVNGCIDYSIK